MTTIPETTRAVHALRGFVPPNQLNLIGTLCRGEEGEFYRAKLVEFAHRVTTMPKTYGQDSKGDGAIAYLHYFGGCYDAYITETDMETEQLQAFGLASFGYGAELGYIDLVEMFRSPMIELDLHFKPTEIGELRKKLAA